MILIVLSSLFLSCLASPDACADGHASCKTQDYNPTESWADVVNDGKQGLEMLQVKGSKVIGNPAPATLLEEDEGLPICHAPAEPSQLPHGKGCPFPNIHTDVWGLLCLNGNKPYDTLKAAWDACARNEECGAILAAKDKKYYLRRMSDPDTSSSTGDKSYIFYCGAREAYFDRKQRREDMEERARQEKVDQVARNKCPPPQNPKILPFGKDCPAGDSRGEKGATCLNGNKAYKSHDEAWLACAEVDECGGIMKMPGNKFFLRRASDPDMEEGNNAYTIQFKCPAVERERERRQYQKTERVRSQAEKMIRTAMTKCPLPESPEILAMGKECPKDAPCLNDNFGYGNLAEAWVACAETQGCGAILQHSNGKHYLRRTMDPDMPGLSSGEMHTVMFSCPVLEGATLKEIEEADEIEELQAELAKTKKLQRFEECWMYGDDTESRDARCDGIMKCARKGYDGRNYGDCPKTHCCSHQKLPRFAECWYFGDDQASRDGACEGAMKCSRAGYNDRTFGDCDERHCCSVDPNAQQPNLVKAANEAVAKAAAHAEKAQTQTAGQQPEKLQPRKAEVAKEQNELKQKDQSDEEDMGKMYSVQHDVSDDEILVRAAEGKCPMPDQYHQAILPFGKDCPHHDAKGGHCLNNNMPFDKLEEAWTSCGQTQGCGAILQHSKTGKFYLRRKTDPDMPRGGADRTVFFSCPSVDNSVLKEEHHAVQAKETKKVETKKVETKKVEQAHETEKAENNAADDADSMWNLFDHGLDQDCGLGEESWCQWDNQAAINGGESRKENVDGEKIVEVCGQICAKAGKECGGFTWTFSSKVCHFRHNATCGMTHLGGTHCFQKKDFSK
mmetsp:Transcript_73953/g.128290  ORF Transcript_73953/g.128290 Transcript_73953/m.128290 type:complete len:845 (+) Transcript_73953:66-2600(+)